MLLAKVNVNISLQLLNVCRRNVVRIANHSLHHGILNRCTSVGVWHMHELKGNIQSRPFTVTKTVHDEDEITNEQMNEMLTYDTELQALLKDIIKDFDPNPPPPEPPKVKQQMEIGTDSQHDPNYLEEEKTSQKMSQSLLQRYKHYRDEDAELILDVDEQKQAEEQEFYLYQEKKDRFKNLNLQRGKEGVFELDELVEILRNENCKDVAVISIPKDLHYANYLIIATAKSPRHSSAVMEYLRKLHKLKKNSKDKYLRIEGEKCHDWKVLDMGNIVLHVFLPEIRSKYDIETLWTVGEDYDSLLNQPQDPFYDILEEEMKSFDAAQQNQAIKQ